MDFKRILKINSELEKYLIPDIVGMILEYDQEDYRCIAQCNNGLRCKRSKVEYSVCTIQGYVDMKSEYCFQHFSFESGAIRLE